MEALLDEQPPTQEGKFPKKLIPSFKHFPPVSIYPNIELFAKLVSSKFMKINPHRRKDNCTRNQRQALQKLKNLPDVVIKPSDKGENVVLWPTKLYEKEALRQLRVPQCYKKLTYNPLTKFKMELTNIIEDAVAQNIISAQHGKYLIPEFSGVSTLYLLPKVHKNLNTPPRRPIVFGNGNLCEAICRLLTTFSNLS